MFQFRRFPSHAYLIQRGMTAYCAAGLPHSEIPGSMDICSSPRLFAACHVLRRLLMPRHSPCALSSLTCSSQSPLRFVSAGCLSASVENSARSLAPRFSPKTRFRRVRTGVTGLLSGLASSVREFLVLFENYAGFTKIDEIVVTLHPSGCCSTINFAPFTFPRRDLSVALLAFCHIVQFSRCRSLTSFEVRSKHSASRMLRFDLKFGGDSRVRTGDLLLARQALSQLSYIPDFFSCGGPEWARTTDLTIISRTL